MEKITEADLYGTDRDGDRWYCVRPDVIVQADSAAQAENFKVQYVKDLEHLSGNIAAVEKAYGPFTRAQR